MASPRSLSTLRFGVLAVYLLLDPARVVGQPAAVAMSPSDSKAAFAQMLCGAQTEPVPTQIPSIGCFKVAPGKSAAGTVEAGKLVVTVNEHGESSCTLDGAVTPCSGCLGPPNCANQLVAVDHGGDGSTVLSVQRKAEGNQYIYSQKTWDARERLLHPSPAEVANQQHLARLVAASNNPTDGPAALSAVGRVAQGDYSTERFADLDELFEHVSQPDQLTDDGMPRALGVTEGLIQFVDAYKSWNSELDRVARWRKARPDSYAADLVEAIVWRQWAWNARGIYYSSTVTSEGWKLFNERLEHADQVLERSKPKASTSPLWYQLRLALARDMGWELKSVQPVFDEATRRFPWYVVFYMYHSNYLSPKWGGSYEAVDGLARRSVTTSLGSDHSLYTRIYWHLTDQSEAEFEPFRDSRASWPLMKTGFEGLMKRYPNSFWNLNAYAAFACRANDGPTYATLRTKLGQEVNPQAWASNYSVDVCDEHLLGRT